MQFWRGGFNLQETRRSAGRLAFALGARLAARPPGLGALAAGGWPRLTLCHAVRPAATPRCDQAAVQPHQKPPGPTLRGAYGPTPQGGEG